MRNEKGDEIVKKRREMQKKESKRVKLKRWAWMSRDLVLFIIIQVFSRILRVFGKRWRTGKTRDQDLNFWRDLGIFGGILMSREKWVRRERDLVQYKIIQVCGEILRVFGKRWRVWKTRKWRFKIVRWNKMQKSVKVRIREYIEQMERNKIQGTWKMML